MADIHITRHYRADRRSVCAVSPLGQLWMVQNMGSNPNEVRTNRYVMNVSAEGIEELIDSLKKDHLEIEVD